MIAKLERAQIDAQQNMEQTQNPTTGATNNNQSTTTEPPPLNGLQLNHWGGLDAFYLFKIFTLDSFSLKHKTWMEHLHPEMGNFKITIVLFYPNLR